MSQSIVTRIIQRVLYQKNNTITKVSKRCLNLLEYQSKNLLENHGVTIQKFKVFDTPTDIVKKSKELNAAEYVVKAQILAGGRGKGTFDSGFKGGVHLTKDANAVEDLVTQMIGKKLVTKQTPKEGILVKKVMVAESVDILRETYFCILMDREHNGPVLLASPDGGVDIEEVAEKTPERLLTIPINIDVGITKEMGDKIADFLQFQGPLRDMCCTEIQNMWNMFLSVDATQLEINPFIETPQGKVVAVDAKIQFDDNAKFRQSHIFEQEDKSESDPREVDAADHGLNFIGMEGNIGCLVNGAGLAMATMDIIKLHGGNPANFLDLGGGVQEHQVNHAFRIITSDANVKGIMVNVFGGIVNTAMIARGIIAASKSISNSVPIVVRLEGYNVDEARKLIDESGMPITMAKDMNDAAELVVKAIG